jgi:hypothetical protein
MGHAMGNTICGPFSAPTAISCTIGPEAEAPAKPVARAAPAVASLDQYSAPKNPIAFRKVGGFQPATLPSADEMKGAAEIRFERGSVSSDPLVPGGKLVLRYNPKLVEHDSHSGQPMSAVTATITIEPGGEPITAPAIVFDSEKSTVKGEAKQAPIVVDIPKDATAVNVVMEYRGLRGATEETFSFPVSK